MAGCELGRRRPNRRPYWRRTTSCEARLEITSTFCRSEGMIAIGGYFDPVSDSFLRIRTSGAIVPGRAAIRSVEPPMYARPVDKGLPGFFIYLNALVFLNTVSTVGN